MEPSEVRDSFNTKASKSRKAKNPNQPDQFERSYKSPVEKQEGFSGYDREKDPIMVDKTAMPYSSPESRARRTEVEASSFISDEEEVMYTDEAVSKSRDQSIKAERTRARLTGSPISYEEAAERVAIKQETGLRVNPHTGAAVANGDYHSLTPFTKDQMDELAERRFPMLSAQAAASGLTKEEQRDAVSLPLAVDAVKRMAATQNDERREQIFKTMGPDMQALVFDVYEAWRAEAEKKQAIRKELGDPDENLITKIIGIAWDNSLGPIFDALYDGFKFAERVAVTGSNINITDAFRPDRYQEEWDKTEVNSFDPEMVSFAKKKYGVKTIDIILELFEIEELENPAAGVAELIAKYADANDLEAISILEQAMNKSAYDENTLDAITYLRASNTSSLGNLYAWAMHLPLKGFGPDDQMNLKATELGATKAQMKSFTATHNLTNVVSMFVIDPFLIGGKARSIYIAGKYGIGAVAQSRNAVQMVEKAFSQKNTRRFFDELGNAMLKADAIYAVDPVRATSMMNSITKQYKKYLSADAIQILRTQGIRNADEAKEFFESGTQIGLMVSGQSARRGKQLTVPHMVQATALVKRASLLARGKTYQGNSAKYIDEIFGAGTSALLPEEAIPVIIEKIKAKDGARFVGRMLGDFVYPTNLNVQTSLEARRTFIGKIMDSVVPRNKSKKDFVPSRQITSRYGWKRKNGLRRIGERWARNYSHFPNVPKGLDISSGKDADKIRDIVIFSGMPRFWADYSADLWKNMNPAQRREFAVGLSRTSGSAMGVDLVNPVDGVKFVDQASAGMKQGEAYAPLFTDMAALAPAIRAAELPIKRIQKQASAEGRALTAQEKKLIIKAEEEIDKIKNQSVKNAPSQTEDDNRIRQAAIYQYQMSDTVMFPSLERMNSMSMRQSYLTALLGDNSFMSTVTNWWTIGTIGGPRFFLRNGLEDAGLYALTGGSWSSYRQGQLYSRAMREATIRKGIPENNKVRGEKLGVLLTASRNIGDKLPAFMGNVILPNLSAAEMKIAKKMGRDGNRDGLVSLIKKAYLRKNYSFFFGGKQLKDDTVKYLDEGADSIYFAPIMDDVSESGSNMVNGSAPGDLVNQMIVNGEVVGVEGVEITLPFVSKLVDPTDITHYEDWLMNIHQIVLNDGIYGPQAIRLVERYIKAKSQNNGGPKVTAIINEYAAFLKKFEFDGMTRSSIYVSEGATGMARRKLDDAQRIFSGVDGKFNKKLYDKIKDGTIKENGKDVDAFSLFDVTGKGANQKVEYRLTGESLRDEIKNPPESVLSTNPVFPIMNDPVKFGTQWAWNAMGRSLARLTREPIFISNYVDARRALQPVQDVLEKTYGKQYAQKWGVEMGVERAYKTTMAFVDDPSIRSNLAWSVRNVARFYRAQEDFYRRMMRTATNQPMAIQRLNLAWHAMDETGFIHSDERGDKYFIWPGNKITSNAVNWFTQQIGDVNFLEGLGMTEFTSQVTRLSPSSDPEALPPTLASPYAVALLATLTTAFPGIAEAQAELMGNYSVGKNPYEQALPTNAKRVIDLFEATFGENSDLDSETAVADATKTAIQIYTSTGLVDETKDYTAAEIIKMRNDVSILGQDIVIIKSVLGPFFPATIKDNPQTVTDFAKSLGVSGMRPVYLEVLDQADGDQNLALQRWVKGNPGRSIFSVSENKNAPDFGSFAQTAETEKFILDNIDFFEYNPRGAAFLAPYEGKANLPSWLFLQAMDAKIPKTVQKYFNQMITAEGYTYYSQLRDAYELRLEEIELMPDSDQKTKDKKALNTGLASAKVKMEDYYPEISKRISGSMSNTVMLDWTDRADFVKGIKDSVEYWMANKENPDKRAELKAKDALTFIEAYEAFKAEKDVLKQNRVDPNYTKDNNALRERWKKVYTKAFNYYPEKDTQWRALVKSASGALGFVIE